MNNVTRELLVQKGRPIAQALKESPPGWEGVQFHLRRFSGTERDWWDVWCLRNCWSEEDAKAGYGRFGQFKPGVKFRAMLVCLTLCNSDGVLLYDVQDAKDCAEVTSLDGGLLDWLYDQAYVVNGLGSKAAEEAAKNSDSGESGDTGSASPQSSDAP